MDREIRVGKVDSHSLLPQPLLPSHCRSFRRPDHGRMADSRRGRGVGGGAGTGCRVPCARRGAGLQARCAAPVPPRFGRRPCAPTRALAPRPPLPERCARGGRAETFLRGLADAADTVARRELFHYPVVDPDAADSPPCVYLCGNSLGLQPVNVGKYVNEELQRWSRGGVRGHFEGTGRCNKNIAIHNGLMSAHVHVRRAPRAGAC